MNEEKIKNILKICSVIAENSKCARRKFGAILCTKDGVQISGGYNGSVRGALNCGEDIQCLKNIKNEPSYQSYVYCPAVHAEVNAIINAARLGISTVDTIMFLNSNVDGHCDRPCANCRRTIINAGVSEIYFVDKDNKIVHEMISSWIPVENSWMILTEADK